MIGYTPTKPLDGKYRKLKVEVNRRGTFIRHRGGYLALPSNASMKIALIQQHATKDKSANVARGLAALETAARNGAELACFAELAFEWFYPQRPAEPDFRELAEPIDGPTVTAFQRKAKELGIVTVINLYERDGDHTYDSSPVIDADGTLLGVTRMIHITEYPCFHEQGYYTPGDKGAPVFKTRAGTIGVAICYDRHFPEYMRALARRRRGPRHRAAGRRGRRMAGRACTKPRCASPRFRTATSPRSAIASARKTASISPASRSSAVRMAK